MRSSKFLILIAFLCAAGAGAQHIDYNGIYRFPVSVGFEY
jgi:hypothetical protein